MLGLGLQFHTEAFSEFLTKRFGGSAWHADMVPDALQQFAGASWALDSGANQFCMMGDNADDAMWETVQSADCDIDTKAGAARPTGMPDIARCPPRSVVIKILWRPLRSRFTPTRTCPNFGTQKRQSLNLPARPEEDVASTACRSDMGVDGTRSGRGATRPLTIYAVIEMRAIVVSRRRFCISERMIPTSSTKAAGTIHMPTTTTAEQTSTTVDLRISGPQTTLHTAAVSASNGRWLQHLRFEQTLGPVCRIRIVHAQPVNWPAGDHDPSFAGHSDQSRTGATCSNRSLVHSGDLLPTAAVRTSQFALGFGGLGLRSATADRNAAYWASWLDALQSVLAPCRSPTTSCMRSPHPVPVAQLPLQRQRKPPTTSLLKAATSPLIGIPQSQRTHTSTTSQGTVSEAGSGTPPALVTSATHFATLPACCFTVRPTHEAVTIPSAEFRFYSSPPSALSAAARATNLGLPWSA
eukprot:s8056_g1.t1